MKEFLKLLMWYSYLLSLFGCRLAPETKPPSQWLPHSLSQKVMLPESEADCSPPSCAKA